MLEPPHLPAKKTQKNQSPRLMNRKIYFTSLAVITAIYLTVELLDLISSVYSLTAFMIAAEIIVLIRRKHLGLPAFPILPRQFKKDFQERFFRED
jgi:uncharacterized membrane protein YeiH